MAEAPSTAPADALKSIDFGGLANTAVYVGFGMMLFALAFMIMTKIAPFSVTKEIEEDQNTSLAILMGSVIIGIAIIVGAAVHGG